MVLKIYANSADFEKKLDVNWSPCELELDFKPPGELKISTSKSKLKVKIDAHQ